MEPESPQFKWTNFDFNMEIHVAGDFYMKEFILLTDYLSYDMKMTIFCFYTTSQLV